MNKELQSILQRLEDVLNGTPWFGRSVYDILNETNIDVVYKKPNANSHSLIELLYHMITWAEFTLKRIEKDKKMDLAAFEKIDWREIDPEIHTWENGVAQFIYLHRQIALKLAEKTDAFLEEKVDYREYNFRFLINGLIEHNIYHLGQITYLNKLL